MLFLFIMHIFDSLLKKRGLFNAIFDIHDIHKIFINIHSIFIIWFFAYKMRRNRCFRLLRRLLKLLT